MRILLHVFGKEVLDLHIGGHDEPLPEPEVVGLERGDCLTQPIGFAPNQPAPYDMDTPNRYFGGDE